MSIESYPLHIRAAHYDEWAEGSAVSPIIVERGVRSLSFPEEIDELLNRNLKNTWGGAWKHGPGWSVSGVDPETGEPTYDGAQFKPDAPVQVMQDGVPKFKRNGEPETRKYLSASKCESEPLFLDTGDPEFWPKVKADITRRILLGEGAKKAGSALSVGEAMISLPGVSNGQRKGRLKKKIEIFCEPGREIVIGFDSDQHYNKNVTRELNRLGCLLKNKGVIVKVLMLPRNTKGIDDFIVAYGGEAFKKLVDDALTFEEWREEYFLHPNKEIKTTNADLPDAEENYQLKAQSALFSDYPWISIEGHLYQWISTHYEKQSEAAIKRRISEWCKVTPVYSGGEWRYAYATATCVDAIYAWVQRAFAIDPAEVNPPGINCLNGTLKIVWHGSTPQWQLIKHDPAVYYTYAGEFEYNPDADPTACDRLLACLDAPQREIFLKTLAATLDLNTIRKFRGRSIRALLCKGDGNNGKDSLREAVSLLYGVGVVSVTVTDGVLYDQGKKFPFAKLEHARISWSSENSSFSSLDAIQGFKAAITGETIYIEHKGVDERPISPATVFFFNINNVPSLQASLEAIQSRWAILSFNKTFKTNADPAKGEIEADPRFRYDPNFLKTEVVPALLNKMLQVLPEVAMTAINYSATESDLREIQEQTNHLWQFARDIGLDYQVGGRVYIGALWKTLSQWYIDNGFIEIEVDSKGKQKKIPHHPSNRDKLISGSNHIYDSFSKLFPKITKERDYSHGDRHGQWFLSGIGINSHQGSAVDQHGSPVDHHSDRSKPAQDRVDHHGSPVLSPLLTQIIDLIKKLPDSELDKLAQLVIHDDPKNQKSSTASDSANLSTNKSGDPLVIHADPSLIPDVNLYQARIDTTNSSQVIGSTNVNGLNTANPCVGGNAEFKQDNSRKNFPNDSNLPELKVGDKCKPKYKDPIWLPIGEELTILKIDGNIVTVTFPGCLSPTGVEAFASELTKTENDQG